MSTTDDELGAQPDVARLIDRRGDCRLVYEPVADLARGTICGYEASERFPDAVTPELWRDHALRRGLEPDWDVHVVMSVLRAREHLPADSFLSCNLRPATLVREPVRRALARAGRLDRLVFELSPRIARRDEARLATMAAELREAGALFSLDHVGGEEAVLRHVLLMRPEFVKLSPQFVAGVHADRARRGLVEGVGQIASRFDAWVIAQGVSDVADLDTLMRLRVPLAQGPLIGVRAKTLTEVAFVLSSYVRERGAAARAPGTLARLLEPAAALAPDDRRTAEAAFALDAQLAWIPLVDERRRPVGLLERSAFEAGRPATRDVLAVTLASAPAEIARRAMLRDPASRFDPLVCCDVRGRYLGLVSVARLVESLADAVEALEREAADPPGPTPL